MKLDYYLIITVSYGFVVSCGVVEEKNARSNHVQSTSIESKSRDSGDAIQKTAEEEKEIHEEYMPKDQSPTETNESKQAACTHRNAQQDHSAAVTF